MPNMKISFLEHICSIDEIFKQEPDLSRDIQTTFPVEAYTHCHINRNKLQATLVPVRNYHRPTDSLTGMRCRATSVAKELGAGFVFDKLARQNLKKQQKIEHSKAKILWL